MVSARENRARVRCRQIGDRVPGPAEGWVQCEVELVEARPVGDWPNLLDGWAGRSLTALLPPAAVARLPDDETWQAEAELVRPGVLRVRP